MFRTKDKMFTRQAGYVQKCQQNKSIILLDVTLLFLTTHDNMLFGLLRVKCDGT